MSTTLEAPEARPPEKADGLGTYLKVIYAPGDAFATLARVPTWGWAALVGIILTIVGTFLALPASLHYSHIAQEQQFSQMSAEQAAAAREFTAKIPQWAYYIFAFIGALFGCFVGWLIASLIYLISAALGGGEAAFKKAWVAAVNLYIIPVLGSLAGGLILLLRGPENANTSTDLFVLPSPALLIHTPLKLAAFLYYGLNVVNIWFYFVAVIALQLLMKVSRVAAIVTVIVVGLLLSSVLALLAK
jgi:hypothetical protein